MNITAIIPARYGSSRFPGKPLFNIRGRSMVSRVASQVSAVLATEKVIVATDDERIFHHVVGEGFRAIMTSAAHQSGTDRCAEAALIAGCDEHEIILNVQGDEPYIKPEQLLELISCFDEQDVEIGTLCRKISEDSELNNPNVVKLVRNLRGDALYFSRSAIPFNRMGQSHSWLADYPYLGHIGLYGFRMATLQRICKLPMSDLEKVESLEQLRWLDYGYRIRAKLSAYPSWAVDVPEDIERLPVDK